MIVDKRPSGIDGELLETLRALRRRRSSTKVVLGVRDILDEPERTRTSLEKTHFFETIREYYDEVWIYGSKDIFNAVSEYRFPLDIVRKTRFCGYESTRYKTFVWTLSAILCAVAGALYVPQVGIINPSEMQPSNSIELAIWAAVGGRGTLAGPLVGALFLNGAKSFLTAAFPSAWLYVLGGIFVFVTLFLPRGFLGLADVWRRRRARTAEKTTTSP